MSVAQEMHMDPKVFYKWSVQEFYHLSLFLAWKGTYTKRYYKIQMREVAKE